MSSKVFKVNLLYFRKLYIALGLIFTVLLVGVIGYSVLEDYSLLDSFFMTIITVATVGYREVKDLDATGKIFTSLLIIFSIGTFAYAMSVITHYVIEGEFQTYFKHYK